MRLGFVFGDYSHKKFEEDIDVVSREFGTFAPLGLGFAAAIAERAGHEVVLIDAHAERLTPPQVLERLRRFDPQALGFMLTTYMFHDNLRYIGGSLKFAKCSVLSAVPICQFHPVPT